MIFGAVVALVVAIACAYSTYNDYQTYSKGEPYSVTLTDAGMSSFPVHFNFEGKDISFQTSNTNHIYNKGDVIKVRYCKDAKEQFVLDENPIGHGIFIIVMCLVMSGAFFYVSKRVK